MASETDTFDIDVDGDGDGTNNNAQEGAEEYYEDDEHTFTVDEPESEMPISNMDGADDRSPDTALPARPDTEATSEKPPTPQGTKRKGPDDRPVDSNATCALMVDDLHWWTTEDDIRGWVNEANAEDELKEISFNEHKVNGKSKGQAYLEFESRQASTAAKHKIDSLTEGESASRKFAVAFHNLSQNPFKTLPKDAPARAKEDRGAAYTTRGYSRGDSGFRGRGRGGFDRGGYSNRNFSGSSGGYNNNAFNNNMGMMNNFGFNRGAMGNMRGGRGGMRGGPGGMMPMGGMPMGFMAGMGMQGEFA